MKLDSLSKTHLNQPESLWDAMYEWSLTQKLNSLITSKNTLG